MKKRTLPSGSKSSEFGSSVEPEARSSLGRAKDEARFTAAPSKLGLPDAYGTALQELKLRIGKERVRAVLAANAAMVLLYWDVGRVILERQSAEGWGAKVIDRLSSDLREAFPDMKGLSPRNLKYMRAFAEAWPDKAIVQGPLAQITWYHNIALLEKLDQPQVRLWYAEKIRECGWSHNVLILQIQGQAHERTGKLTNNFELTLPPAQSDLAVQIFKDPYLFDFLGTADPRTEREMEVALVDHIQKFLLELGAGFAFVGRQVHLEIGNEDFYIDLLFYHLRLRCFVVVELKSVAFDAAFVGQLNLYLSAVDDLLRHTDDKPTIGLLLCRSRNKLVVEYALRDLKKPVGVAEWQTRLTQSLPKDLKGSLPSIAEIEAELAAGEIEPLKVGKKSPSQRKRR
ncbi:PDDEXK nuclease domain-containing protein [Verrucomicrobium spinosum]|uniref:PDDEXK nuclease domain-containing protein n=1 Tax=Verrucomicrobium spinosum TaxID=2736 RepID=UPI0002E77EBA|nr:PDDEXK nuclease domain-containing protein [Verrucomicrobium spinosum]